MRGAEAQLPTSSAVEGIGLTIGASGAIGAACHARLRSTVTHPIASSRRPLGTVDIAGEWLPCDLNDASSRNAFVDAVAKIGVPLRYLVFAAGVAHRGTIATATEEDWEATLRTNLVGPALVLSELSRQARWMQGASVVAIGSLSARRAMPARALYGASKAGFEHFFRSAAVELAPRGIAVNTISLGVTDTPFLAGGTDSLADFTENRIPIRRLGEPEEVAQVVASVVASPGFLTGATIDLDGGAGILG